MHHAFRQNGDYRHSPGPCLPTSGAQKTQVRKCMKNFASITCSSKAQQQASAVGRKDCPAPAHPLQAHMHTPAFPTQTTQCSDHNFCSMTIDFPPPLQGVAYHNSLNKAQQLLSQQPLTLAPQACVFPTIPNYSHTHKP